MSEVAMVVSLALRDTLRRRVLAALAGLTLVLALLYALAVDASFGDGTLLSVTHLAGATNDDQIGTTLLSLAAFGSLCLGTVLAAFLTLGAVTGDAERGALQTLVVRPVGRANYLIGRFLAAAGIAAGFSLLTFGVAALTLGAIGEWWPSGFLPAAMQIALAVVVLAALSLLGSVFLAPTANGIVLFVVFGIGLLAGLLGQIGVTIASERLERIGEIGAWALPFAGAYQRALEEIGEAAGTAQLLIDVAPFAGGNAPGAGVLFWAGGFALLAGAIAVAAFRRMDL